MSVTNSRIARMVAIGALVLSTAGLAACGSSESTTDAGKTLKVHVFPGNIVSLYAQVGVTEGIYKSEGLDVELVDIGTGPQATAALSAGSVDLMLNTGDNALSAKAQGLDTVAVVGNQKQPIFQLIVKDKSKFPHAAQGYPAVMKDLVNKKVSAYALGSATDRFVKLLLEDAGLSDKDVTFVPVGGPGQAASALQAGQIDVATDVFTLGIATELSGRGSILLDCSATDCGNSVETSSATGQAYWATQKQLDKKKSSFETFVRAQKKINAWVLDPKNAAALTTIIKKAVPVPTGVAPDKYIASIEKLIPTYFSLDVSQASIEATMKAMISTGELKKPLDTAGMVWNKAPSSAKQ